MGLSKFEQYPFNNDVSNNQTVIEISEGTVYLIIAILVMLLVLNFFTLFYVECICGLQRPKKVHYYDESKDTEKEW